MIVVSSLVFSRLLLLVVVCCFGVRCLLVAFFCRGVGVCSSLFVVYRLLLMCFFGECKLFVV